MRTVVCLFLLGGLSLVSGCADAEPQAMATTAPVNSLCPIMGHEVTADGGRVDYDGQTVGFCCPGCIDSWNALSAEEKATSLANPPAHAHEDHSEEGSADSHESAEPETSGESADEPSADEPTEE